MQFSVTWINPQFIFFLSFFFCPISEQASTIQSAFSWHVISFYCPYICRSYLPADTTALKPFDVLQWASRAPEVLCDVNYCTLNFVDCFFFRSCIVIFIVALKDNYKTHRLMMIRVSRQILSYFFMIIESFFKYWTFPF